MVRRVVKRDAAKRDLVECFVYIGADNEEAALRFLSAADETFAELAQMPTLGAAYRSRTARTRELRRWRIRGFEKYLIFYRPLEDGIEVVRVLHGAREIEPLFES